MTSSPARAFSLNCQGGLIPTSATHNRRKDKLAVVTAWLDEGASFVCLQDLGMNCRRDTPSAELKEAMCGHSIICAGSELDPSGTVAIAVHKSWTVVNQFRLPGTSLCIGAELLKGNNKILVVSVYLPPGMDSPINMSPNGPRSVETTKRRELRLESYRILRCVRTWARDYDAFFICGDFNQAPPVGKKKKDPLSVVLLNKLSPAFDLFKALKNNRPTRRKKNGRRIDYVLANITHFNRPHRGLWDATLNAECSSDHFALAFSFPVDLTIPLGLSSSYSRRLPDLARASAENKRLFLERVNSRLRDVETRTSIAHPKGEKHRLDQNMRETARIIREEALLCLPIKQTARKTRNSSLKGRKLRKLARHLRSLLGHVDSLVCGIIRKDDRSLRTAARNLAILGYGLQGWESFSPVDWSTWGWGASELLSLVEEKLAQVNALCPSRMIRISDRLWRAGRGNRSFFQRLLRGSADGRIDSAVNPTTNERTWDPSLYPKLVAEQIAPLFCNKVELPTSRAPREAPCAGRCGGARKTVDPAVGSCHDVRCMQSPPDWWDDYYSPAAVSTLGTKVLKDILTPTTEEEILRAIRRIPNGKTPGRDGVSAGLLKLLSEGQYYDEGASSPIIRILTHLTNESFRLGYVPAHAKDGLIRMIPKHAGSGAVVTDVALMRPITLLSELGKISSRVLADRVSTVFANHPSLLHPSQRAFLRNGDTGQCVDMAVDVMEDHRKTRSESDLLCLSYDQAKAFDSVQEYTIRCTLQRFGFPPEAVSFCCSTLNNAASAVITHAGPTERFPIRTSVRQGDPFAPLLFIMVTDPLHRGYADGHAGHGAVGYTFRNGLTVTSCGYADDVLVFAESADSLLRMHEWTRSFFGAHSFKLNTKKTKLTSTGKLALVKNRFLGVNGIHAIIPIPPTQSFRYLGVMISLDGSFKGELTRLERNVQRVRDSIRTHGMTCTSGVDAVNAYLVPQLDLGLRIIPHSSSFMKTLTKWRDQLQDTILSTQGAWIKRPNRAAFCEVTGMIDLPRYCRYVRAALTLQRLNTRDSVLPPTAWARLDAAKPGSPKAELIDYVNTRSKPSGRNRVVDALVAHGLGLLQLQYNEQNFDVTPVSSIPACAPDATDIDHVNPDWWAPWKSPNRIFDTSTAGLAYHVYPDGSTGGGPGASAGYAAVIVDSHGRHKVTSSGIKRSGSNYPAEMAGILAGILACPSQADLFVHTDCLGGMQAIQRRDSRGQFRHLATLGEAGCCVSEPERIRSGARSFLTSIRKVIDARKGATSFLHVRSHTGALDRHSTWNEVADKHANIERRRSPPGGLPFTFNEERVIATLNGDHVHGDFRRWAQRTAAQCRRRHWAETEGHVSEVIRDCEEGIAPLCAIVRKRGDAEQTLLLMEALCSRVPCGHRFSLFRNGPSWPDEIWSCQACGAPGLETTTHILSCPATDFIRSTATSEMISALLPGPESKFVLEHTGTHQRRTTPHLSAIRTALSLTRQLDTTAATREDGFLQWCSWDPEDWARGADGSGWNLDWDGQFILITPEGQHWRGAARKARKAIAKLLRPTRIAILLPAAEISNPQALKGAQWIAEGEGKILALFQNALAEAVSPCLEDLPALSFRLGNWKGTRGTIDRKWPPLADAAWCLDRGRRSVSKPIRSWGKYVDVGTGLLPQVHTFPRLARRAIKHTNNCTEYGRRLGVLDPSYANVLDAVVTRATGSRPSLKVTEDSLTALRTSLWDAAMSSFKAARQARKWVYSNDPNGGLARAEADRKAQWLFELQRKAEKEPSKVSGKKPKKLRTSGTQRRSTRAVSRSHFQSDFWWNPQDQYVLDLDEVNAPTSGNIHTRISDRSKCHLHSLTRLV